MEKYRNSVSCLAFLSGFTWALAIVLGLSYCPGQSLAGQSPVPEGTIIFEDKQARVIIIKTGNGVILEVRTDDQGRVTVKELEHEPPQPDNNSRR
ncbi:MAG: hypothetical protein AB1724_04995 [Thermodesulfobacteriota bacterium]